MPSRRRRSEDRSYCLVALKDYNDESAFEEALPLLEDVEDIAIIPLDGTVLEEVKKNATDEILSGLASLGSEEYAYHDGIDESMWPSDWEQYFTDDSEYIIVECTDNGYKSIMYSVIGSRWINWKDFDPYLIEDEPLQETKRATKFKQTIYGAKKNIFTFAIGSPENPMAEELSEEENKQRCKNFEKWLKDCRLNFFKAKGIYGVEETSYLIANINLDQCFCMFGNKHYNQESFIFGRVYNIRGSVEYQYWEAFKNKNGFFCKGTAFNTINVSNDDQSHTEYKDFKFKIPFDFIENSLDRISEKLDYLYGYDPMYRDLLKHVALSEKLTLKHYLAFNYFHLLTEKEYKASHDFSGYDSKEFVDSYKNYRYDHGAVEGMLKED